MVDWSIDLQWRFKPSISQLFYFVSTQHSQQKCWLVSHWDSRQPGWAMQPIFEWLAACILRAPVANMIGCHPHAGCRLVPNLP